MTFINLFVGLLVSVNELQTLQRSGFYNHGLSNMGLFGVERRCQLNGVPPHVSRDNGVFCKS